jgi:FtsH-binding integral membrane protein
MDNNTTVADSRIPLGKLALGIALLLVGVLSLTDYLEMFDLREIWRFWPLLLIFIGVASEVDSLRQRKSGGGHIIAAVGVWMLVANHHFFGLSHRTAFPLGIAVVGLGVILHALIDEPVAAKKEEGKRGEGR